MAGHSNQMERKQSLLSLANKVHHLFYYPAEHENVASLIGLKKTGFGLHF